MTGNGSDARPWVVGHRGSSGTHPENSLAAFDAAVAAGVNGVELDVRRSADGAVVVHHDAHLADGRAIVELTRADLPDSVPDLAAVLDVCSGIEVNVEIKSEKKDPDFDSDYWISRAVVDIARAGDALDRVVVTSFDHAAVDCLRADDAPLRTGWIGMRPPNWDRLVERGHSIFNPWHGLVTEKFVAQAHRRGIFVGTWTVNDLDTIPKLAATGVDAILTDHPADAIARVNALR